MKAELTESKLGFELASNGNGLALQQLETPITGQTTIRIKIRPPAAFPSNGFLVFGAEPSDAATVKCGILVGGNKLCAFNGAYPPDKYSQVEADLRGNVVYDLEMNIDLPQHNATLKLGEFEVQHELLAELDESRYVGFDSIRTRADFGKIKHD